MKADTFYSQVKVKEIRKSKQYWGSGMLQCKEVLDLVLNRNQMSGANLNLNDDGSVSILLRGSSSESFLLNAFTTWIVFLQAK